ncbi:MAG: bifunctional phosphoribosylaminoimidazolecarboxamide formyltransferase/IMP cyclohydrolase [Peptococcaceae bacterium]|nr:bifunctional phosphoribosylaminoimidazolecarboxamide formyltransferase/IMP cyclohydrolase [Peptococcaceae bacterium]
MKRALISVSDKHGVIEFAEELVSLGFAIISTGGTAQLLRTAGISVTEVQEITSFPEMMDGRVKTLHPKVHGGILMRRDNSEDINLAKEQGIEPIDLVCINLYPFAATISRMHTLDEAIENIDIGGPAMVRSAAKNHAFVAVVTSPAQYAEVIRDLREKSEVSHSLRRRLAVEALLHTAHYDSTISMYFWQAFGLEGFPQELGLPMTRTSGLRYGENPHQAAAFYREPVLAGGLSQAKQLQGKELSFCNINDANAALELVKEFSRPAAVAIKHTNPCGVALGETIYDAFTKAHAADPVSIFGGIIALNREVDVATAGALAEIFLEVVIAPQFSAEALVALGKKKNLRLLAVDMSPREVRLPQWDLKKVDGGYLLQTPDVTGSRKNWRVVTTALPTDGQIDDMEFGWTVVKHVKSNAIVIVKDGVTLGVGMGQTNRIDPTLQAMQRAGGKLKGAVLASDAFFPMSDVLEKCAEVGIVAIIQPGGSMRDSDSLAVAEQAGIAMVYTGERHFRH